MSMFLINHRQEEIQDHVDSIVLWNEVYSEQFKSLVVAVADLNGVESLEKESVILLTDLIYLHKNVEPKMSEPEVRVALNMAYLRSNGEVVDKTIKESKIEEHYYDSVTYNKTITPTNITKFLPTLDSLDPEKSVQPMYIWIGS